MNWRQQISGPMLLAVLTVLPGCGEAVFFTHIRVAQSEQQSDASALLGAVATQLGYARCPEGPDSYCNTSTHHSFRIVSATSESFEVEFGSFGVPGRQRGASEEMAAALKARCADCQFYSKERNVWGFLKDDSQWQAF